MSLLRPFAAAALGAGVLLPAFAAHATSLTAVYSFPASPFPVYPFGLVVDQSKLYGTALQGGDFDDGMIFSIAPKKGTQATLYSFSGSDGQFPAAALTLNNGVFYGITGEGGGGGAGTVFMFDPSTNATSALYSFPPNSGLGDVSGAYPQAALLYLQGSLYGTTTAGGKADWGVIYKVNATTGAETVLYNFAGGTDGAVPSGALLYDGGNFYGTTEAGGAGNAGTVFKFAPATHKEAVIHSFSGNDGVAPLGALVYYQGSLYGTTNTGGTAGLGTVFQINLATGAETVLHSFAGSANSVGATTDGAFPAAGLTLYKGVLYGTTVQGGGNSSVGPSNAGTIFEVDPTTGSTTVLYSFTGGTDGALPSAGLTFASGAFYGTTAAGGGSDMGTVFKLVP